MPKVMTVLSVVGTIAMVWVGGHILLNGIAGGLPLKAVLVLSSMPVAFNALVPPSLYGLDLDLANSCFLVSVLGLAALLPALHFALDLL